MKEGKRRVVISTFYEGHAIKHIIPKLSPDKLILLIDEPKQADKKDKMYELLASLKDFFKESIIIETIKISSYDIPQIMAKVIERIDSEDKEGNEIIIHITEGRKITSLALLFSAYARKEKVNSAYYITEEEHNLINLPILNFQLSHNKKLILKEINTGTDNPLEIINKLKLKKSTGYKNITELKSEGFITNETGLKITELGKVMIL